MRRPVQPHGLLDVAREVRIETHGPSGVVHSTIIWVVVDAGEDYAELRGVELRGRVEVVGEVPRTGEPVPELDGPEQAFADRYSGGVVGHDGRHAWLRLTPEKIVSWDFRKVAAERQRRQNSS